MENEQIEQNGYYKLPVPKLISTYPLIKISENMDIAVGDKDAFLMLLKKDHNGQYNVLDIDIESCCQQLDLCGMFRTNYVGYNEINSYNVGQHASELSRVTVANLENMMNASRPRFFTFFSKEITNTQNLIIVGFRSNHCGIFQIDSTTSQYHIIMNIVAILDKYFTEEIESNHNYTLFIEDIKFAGVALTLETDSLPQIIEDNNAKYFSNLKFIPGCVFLKQTTYSENGVEKDVGHIVLFVRFCHDDIQILGEVHLESSLSLKLSKCVFEQIDKSNYIAYCCYSDSSMDVIVFNLQNYCDISGNTASILSFKRNQYSTGEIKKIIHLNKNCDDVIFNFTTIIVQSFNVTFMEWSLRKTDDNYVELIYKCYKNIEISGILGIASFFKVSATRFMYHLEQGGLFSIDSQSFNDIDIDIDIHVKALRLNTNYNLFHVELSPLECFFVSFYQIPLEKYSRRGFGRAVGFLVEMVPNMEINVDKCFSTLINVPSQLSEFKQYINGMHQNKLTTEKCARLIPTLLDSIQKNNSENAKPSSLCVLGNVEGFLEALKVDTSFVANQTLTENVNFIQRLELRLFMMCIYEKANRIKEFLYCIYQLYCDTTKGENQSSKSKTVLGRSPLFFKSLSFDEKNLGSDGNGNIVKICEYCIKTECTMNHFDYNERGLIPLVERTWAFHSDIKCDFCLEKVCLTNLHYVYCANGHRIQRCQLSYDIISSCGPHLECVGCKMPFSIHTREWIANNFNCLVCVYCLSTLKYSQ